MVELWFVFKMCVQAWFRRKLGIEQDVFLIAQHISAHERRFDILQQDYDLIRQTDETLRRRYRAVCFERMDNLHTMQTSRLQALERRLDSRLLPEGPAKSKRR